MICASVTTPKTLCCCPVIISFPVIVIVAVIVLNRKQAAVVLHLVLFLSFSSVLIVSLFSSSSLFTSLVGLSASTGALGIPGVFTLLLFGDASAILIPNASGFSLKDLTKSPCLSPPSQHVAETRHEPTTIPSDPSLSTQCFKNKGRTHPLFRGRLGPERKEDISPDPAHSVAFANTNHLCPKACEAGETQRYLAPSSVSSLSSTVSWGDIRPFRGRKVGVFAAHHRPHAGLEGELGELLSQSVFPSAKSYGRRRHRRPGHIFLHPLHADFHRRTGGKGKCEETADFRKRGRCIFVPVGAELGLLLAPHRCYLVRLVAAITAPIDERALFGPSLSAGEQFLELPSRKRRGTALEIFIMMRRGETTVTEGGGDGSLGTVDSDEDSKHLHTGRSSPPTATSSRRCYALRWGKAARTITTSLSDVKFLLSALSGGQLGSGSLPSERDSLLVSQSKATQDEVLEGVEGLHSQQHEKTPCSHCARLLGKHLDWEIVNRSTENEAVSWLIGRPGIEGGHEREREEGFEGPCGSQEKSRKYGDHTRGSVQTKIEAEWKFRGISQGHAPHDGQATAPFTPRNSVRADYSSFNPCTGADSESGEFSLRQHSLGNSRRDVRSAGCTTQQTLEGLGTGAEVEGSSESAAQASQELPSKEGKRKRRRLAGEPRGPTRGDASVVRGDNTSTSSSDENTFPVQVLGEGDVAGSSGDHTDQYTTFSAGLLGDDGRASTDRAMTGEQHRDGFVSATSHSNSCGARSLPGVSGTRKARADNSFCTDSRTDVYSQQRGKVGWTEEGQPSTLRSQRISPEKEEVSAVGGAGGLQHRESSQAFKGGEKEPTFCMSRYNHDYEGAVTKEWSGSTSGLSAPAAGITHNENGASQCFSTSGSSSSDHEGEKPSHPLAPAEHDNVLWIWTDGACKSNGRGADARAGIGVFFGDGDTRNVARRLQGLPQTNQRAELQAIHEALVLLRQWEEEGRGYWGGLSAQKRSFVKQGQDVLKLDFTSVTHPESGVHRGATDTGVALPCSADKAVENFCEPGKPLKRDRRMLQWSSGVRTADPRCIHGDSSAEAQGAPGGLQQQNSSSLPTKGEQQHASWEGQSSSYPCDSKQRNDQRYTLDDFVVVNICSDSYYAIRCVTEWVSTWKANGWRTAAGTQVRNRDLIEAIDALLEGRKRGNAYHTQKCLGNSRGGFSQIAASTTTGGDCGKCGSAASEEESRWGGRGAIHFVLVKGHSGDYGNNMADRLASFGASLPLENEESGVEPAPIK